MPPAQIWRLPSFERKQIQTSCGRSRQWHKTGAGGKINAELCQAKESFSLRKELIKTTRPGVMEEKGEDIPLLSNQT